MERQVIERYAGRSVVVYLKPDYEKIQGVLELGDGDSIIVGGEAVIFDMVARVKLVDGDAAPSVPEETSAVFLGELEECFGRMKALPEEEVFSDAYFREARPRTFGQQTETDKLMNKYKSAVRNHEDAPNSKRMAEIIRDAQLLWKEDRVDAFAGKFWAFMLYLVGKKEESADVCMEVMDFGTAMAVYPSLKVAESAVREAAYQSMTPRIFAFIAGLDAKHLVPVLQSLFESVIANVHAEIDADYRRECFTHIAAISWKVLNFSGWQDKKELLSERNIASLKAWLDALPEAVRKTEPAPSEPHVSAHSDVTENAAGKEEAVGQDTVFEGEIVWFNRDSIYGHIHSPAAGRCIEFSETLNRDDIFFHLYQTSDTELRRILLLNTQEVAGLKVTFRLGIKDDGRISAYDVKASCPLPEAKPVPDGMEEDGKIESFDKVKMTGRIISSSDGSKYGFEVSGVADPLLYVFLVYDPKVGGHPVTFVRTFVKNGQVQAEDIVSAAAAFPDEKLSNWERAGVLDKARKLVEDSPHDAADRSAKEGMRIDRVVHVRHIALDPYDPETAKKSPPAAGPVFVPPPPPPEDYYLAAKEAADRKNFDEAEQLYIKAVSRGDSRELAAGELLGLYRERSLFGKARDFLERYGDIFSAERKRSFWIQYYEASGEGYGELLRLYDESAAAYGDDKLDTKLAFIIKKARLQYRNSDFQAALAACDEGLSLTPNSGYQNLQASLKKIKALSLRALGRNEEAASLARELRRIPTFRADTDLMAILGTQKPDEEAAVNSFTLLPAFLQDKIRYISIDEKLHTEFVTEAGYKKGHYDSRGNLIDVRTEYRSLVAGSKPDDANPAKAERCFAIARYVYKFLACADSRETSSYPELSEEIITANAYKGLEHMLYHQLEQKHYDSARYYCLLMLKRPGSEKAEDWMRIFICSYFDSGLVWDRKRDKWTAEDLRALSRSSLKDSVDFDEFFGGLLSVAASGGSSITDQVLSILLYHPYPEYSGELLRKLGLDANSTYEEVLERFTSELALFKDRQQNFAKAIASAGTGDIMQSSSISKTESCIDGHRYIYGKDKAYVSALRNILAQLKRYVELDDFDSRIYVLDQVINAAGSSISQIVQQPTRCSYECFLPVLNNILRRAVSEKSQQYAIPPELSCLVAECIRQDRRVTAVIEVKNSLARQKAMNVRAEVTGLPVGVVCRKTDIDSVISGGARSECILSIELPENYEDTSIEFQLRILYQYYSMMPSSEDGLPVQAAQGEYKPSLPPLTLNYRENFTEIPNPFSHYSNGHGVDDPDMVFGRDDDIAGIMNRLCSDGKLTRGRSIALYGQKRSGKTTLLYQIRRRIEEEFAGRTLSVDLGSVGSYGWEGGFNRGMMHQIVRGIQDDLDYDDELYDAACRCGITFPDNILYDENYSDVFNAFMKEFTSFLEEERPGCSIVIFLDEFTYYYSYIKEGKVDAASLDFWKAMCEVYKVILVIVGQDSMTQLKQMSPCANALAATELYPVRYLKPEHSERLIRKPLEKVHAGVKIDDEAVERLFRLTYGSAYLLMILCSCMVDYLNANLLSSVSPQIVDKIADEAFRTGRISRQHFQPMYNDSLGGNDLDHLEAHDRENLRLLAAVAASAGGDHEASVSDFSGLLEDWDAKKTDEMLQALVDREVLCFKDGRYRIYVGLLEEWLKHYYQGGVSL